METKVYNYIKIENCDVYITENGALESALSIEQVDQLSLGKGCTLNHLPDQPGQKPKATKKRKAVKKVTQTTVATQRTMVAQEVNTAAATAERKGDKRQIIVKEEKVTQVTETGSYMEESLERAKYLAVVAMGVKIAAGSTVAFPPLSLPTIPLVAGALMAGKRIFKNQKK